MIDALERKLGKIAAAGLMARAALSLGHVEETKGEQESIIAQLIDETRNRLGISREDNAPDTLSRIADFLDSESDKLLSPTDTDLALGRLAERGDLPSDLYEINIIKNISDIYGSKFSLEKSLIETTVMDFAQEQHYGPPRKPHDPAMISLFVRSFRTKWLLKNFVMLVAAKRDGFKLHVHQAWRIYPSKVNIAGANTPVQLLQRFSDEYGAEIDINGRIGHFFLFSATPAPSAFKFNMGRAKERNIVVSQFNQNDSRGRPNSALIVAIDLDKYKMTLKALGVKREDIIDEFAKAPKAIL
jgi:hypothetical protein